jgi:hypothetical protein
VDFGFITEASLNLADDQELLQLMKDACLNGRTECAGANWAVLRGRHLTKYGQQDDWEDLFNGSM